MADNLGLQRLPSFEDRHTSQVRELYPTQSPPTAALSASALVKKKVLLANVGNQNIKSNKPQTSSMGLLQRHMCAIATWK